MKRVVAATILTTMVLAGAMPTIAGGPPAPLCGDVNDSNTLTSSDALLVLRKSVGQPVTLMCSAYNQQIDTCLDDLSDTDVALQGCLGGSSCGNDVIDSVGEHCDGEDLGGRTCLSLGFGGGTLACTGSCWFDTSSCTSGGTCGDGVVNAVGEQCDGMDLDGTTCDSFNYPWGTLACNGACKFDVSGCVNKCADVGGVDVGGSCWFYGADGENCDTTCANARLVYDTATLSYAGTDAYGPVPCMEVFTALGVGGAAVGDIPCGDSGIGCAFFAPNDFKVRCIDFPTDSTSGAPSYRRACACRQGSVNLSESSARWPDGG